MARADKPGETPLQEQVRRAAADLAIMHRQLWDLYGDRLGADSAEALAVLVALGAHQLWHRCQHLRAATSAYPRRSWGGAAAGHTGSRDGQQAARLRLLTVAVTLRGPLKRLLEVLDGVE